MTPTFSRTAAAIVAAVSLTAGMPASQARAAAARQLHVYKTPTCGCCGNWVRYMQAHGFTATTTDMPDVTPVKIAHHVPAAAASCHTTVVGGYVIEGHVPVEDVRRLLKERPAIAGLAAPGMPAGSPGMDVPNSPSYDVVAFDKNGKTTVFATHASK